MEAALTFEEIKQKTVIPKQVLGLTAAILAGTAATPMNMHAVQGIESFETPVVNQVSIKQMEEIVNPQPKNLKTLEYTNGSDVFGINSVYIDPVAEAQKEIMRLRERAVTTSLLWQGVPYKYGGTSRSGIDCSAFTQAVFRQIGIELHRGSYGQYRQGVGIPKSKLEPGDLVFFNTNGTAASHVGIYLGDSQFISATKYGVEVQPLEMPYWAGTYHASRRVIDLTE